MQSMLVLSPWKRYKRLKDNVKLEARLVEVEDRGKYMEVKESRGEEARCPHCGELLTQLSGNEFPRMFLDPKTFHPAHRPLEN